MSRAYNYWIKLFTCGLSLNTGVSASEEQSGKHEKRANEGLTKECTSEKIGKRQSMKYFFVSTHRMVKLNSQSARIV